MELIDKLHLLMQKNNIKNLSQLSKETNIPYTTLKSIFNRDVNDIRLSTSKKLCNYFKISLDDLFDDNIELTSLKNIPLSEFNTDKPVKDNEKTEYNNVPNKLFNEIDTEGLDEEDIKKINIFVEFLKNKKNQIVINVYIK